MTRGLILFAHGAREPRWAEPFERLLRCVRALRPALEVRLAFLEIMKPGMPESVAELIASGCTEVRVVPVFLGEGGHVRRDLPILVDQLRLQYPDVPIKASLAVGEEEAVLDAIAAYCLREMESVPGMTNS